MIDIPLQAVANQELSIPLENSRYVLTIKEANGTIAATVERDGVVIVRNARVVGDGLILQHDYQWSGYGNFMLTVQDDALPDYTQFGITQFLVFLTAAEMDGVRE